MNGLIGMQNGDICKHKVWQLSGRLSSFINRMDMVVFCF